MGIWQVDCAHVLKTSYFRVQLFNLCLRVNGVSVNVFGGLKESKD